MASFFLCKLALFAFVLLQILSCSEAQFSLPGIAIDDPTSTTSAAATTTAVATTTADLPPSTTADPPASITSSDITIPTSPSIPIPTVISTSEIPSSPAVPVSSLPSVAPVQPSSTTPSATPSSVAPVVPTSAQTSSKETLAPSKSVSTPSGSSNVSTPTSSTKADGEKKSNTPAIIGGVVGGVVGLALIGGLITFLNRRGGCTSRSEKPKSDFKDFEMTENDFPQRRAPTGGLQGIVPISGSPTVPQLNNQGNFYNDNGYGQNYSNVQSQSSGQDGYYYDNYSQGQGYYTDGRYYYENGGNAPVTGYVPQQNYQQYQTSPPVQPMVAEYSKPDLADSKPHEKV
ncbi:hypothetical protein J3Q64DRAFT_1713002 [Phycomyces blakesleeanus]|uniref:Mid2 domain-containing protein n=1 Tax=Phycomyces blakesleeanus TaxID=4837 RepID=A0ABR3BF75_PHYBL